MKRRNLIILTTAVLLLAGLVFVFRTELNRIASSLELPQRAKAPLERGLASLAQLLSPKPASQSTPAVDLPSFSSAGLESSFTAEEPRLFEVLRRASREPNPIIPRNFFSLEDAFLGGFSYIPSVKIFQQVSDEEVFKTLYPNFYLKTLSDIQDKLIQFGFLSVSNRVPLSNEENVFALLKNINRVLFEMGIISKEQLHWSNYTLRKEFWDDKRNEEKEVREILQRRKLFGPSASFDSKYQSLTPKTSEFSFLQGKERKSPPGAITIAPWDAAGVFSLLIDINTAQAQLPGQTVAEENLNEIADRMVDIDSELRDVAQQVETQDGLNQRLVNEINALYGEVDSNMKGLILIKDHLAEASNPAGALQDFGKIASSLMGIMGSAQKIGQTVKDPSFGNIISAGSSVISSIKDIKKMIDGVTDAAGAASRFPNLAGALGMLGNSVGGTAGTIIGIVGDVLNLDVNDIIDTIESIEKFLDINLGGLKDLLGELGGLLNDLSNAIDDLIGGFKDAISGLLNDLGLGDLLGSLSDIFGGLGELTGLFGDIFGGLLGGVIPIPIPFFGEECYRQGSAAGGGADLAAPCCNCGWKCIPTPKGCIWQFMQDCGDPSICEIPLGCKNLICPGRPMIWDPATGICGCSGGGGGGGAGAPAIDESGAFFGPSVAQTGDGEFTFFESGNTASAVARLSEDGSVWEFYAPDGTLSTTLPADNVRNVTSYIKDAEGNMTGVVSANQYGFNVYGSDGTTLTGTVRNDQIFNSFDLYDAQGKFDATIPNLEAMQAELAFDSPGLSGSGTNQELFLADTIQTQETILAQFKADPSSRVDNAYFDLDYPTDQKTVLENAIKESNLVFKSEATANTTIVMYDKGSYGEIAATTAKEYLDSKGLPSPSYPVLQQAFENDSGAFVLINRMDGSRTIFVNGDLVTQYPFTAKEGFSTIETVSDLFTHERLHIVDSNLPLVDAVQWNNLYSKTISCGCGAELSTNFKTNVVEGFSEAGTAVAKTGGDPTPYLQGKSPQAQELIRQQFDFFKGLGVFNFLPQPQPFPQPGS